MPGKRSDPRKLNKELQQIVEDMESRLPPDSEDPESVQRRQERYAPPRKRGSKVIGFKKRGTGELS